MAKNVNPLLIGLTAAAVLPDPDKGDVWIKLMPSGTFSLREGRGPFTAGDKAQMQRIVEASKAYAAGTDLMIDYDHQSVFSAIPGVGGRAPAAGWIKELQARDDGIWGRVEWTAEAAAAIKAQQYRYISPYFLANKTTGQVTQLVNAGLVNMPALDLTAIAASLNLTEDSPMKKVAQALGLAEDASEDAIVAAITGNAEKIAAAVGLKADAKLEDVTAAIKALTDARGEIAVAAGLKADAAPKDVVAAVAAATSGADMVPKTSFEKLSQDFKALQTSVTTDKANEAVTAAVKAGKVTPAQKDWATKRAMADLADFEAFVASAPVIVGAQLGDKKLESGGDVADPVAIAASARAYQAEQSAKGIHVSTIEAVAFVTKKK